MSGDQERKTCGCGRCIWEAIQGGKPNWCLHAFADRFLAVWLKHCPECGNRLLPGGETEPGEVTRDGVVPE